MLEENAHVSSFLGEVQKIYRPQEVETFWECEPAFRALLQSPFLTEVINSELKRSLNLQGPNSNWLSTELVLHRGGGYGLSISVFESPQRYIHSLPYHAMYAAVGGESTLFCNFFDLPKNFRNEIFDPSLRLTPAGTMRVEAGNVLLLRSGERAYDFACERPVPVLKFMTTVIYPLEWLFTRNGLQAWQANDADLSYTQLRVAADVAGKFAHQSSLQPLKQLAQHRHHAVRWAAIQNLARLSRSEAIEHLSAAVNDPHPHVQRAARKTLEKLQTK